MPSEVLFGVERKILWWPKGLEQNVSDQKGLEKTIEWAKRNWIENLRVHEGLNKNVNDHMD